MAEPTITPTSGRSALAHPSALEGPRTFYFTRAYDRAQRNVHGQGLLDRPLAFSAFALLLFLYVALPSLMLAGLPLRGLLAMGVLSFLVLVRPSLAAMAFRRYFPIIIIAAGLALLGTFVSVVNRTSLDIIVNELLEVHFQLAVLMLVAAILANICGARLCMWAIVTVICASGLFAFLQMLDFGIAWDIRKSLGPMSMDHTRPSTVDWRPTGLSYSPIQLSTQLCLAFAAFAAVRHAERRQLVGAQSADPAVILALPILVAGSFATMTRSPILGGVIFLVAYVMLYRQMWLAVSLAIAAGLIYIASPFLLSFVESEVPRMLQTDDISAAGRSVFAYYGIRLFIDNPLGYGFGFQPAELWAPYWSDLYMMRGSSGTQVKTLHNYVLSMINIYGIGLLLFAPLAIKLLKRAGPYAIFFIPYAVHILFHNSGPFFSDMIIWFVIASIGAATAQTSFQGQGRVAASPPRLGPRYVRASGSGHSELLS